MDPSIHYLGHGEATIAFFLTLNAVNFGSGYFPLLLGDPAASGFRAVAAALTDRFEKQGPIPAEELARLTPADCAALFGQDLADPLAAELMALFSRGLNDLGRLLLARFGGDFGRLVEAAGHSAGRLVGLLAEMPLFRDVAEYRGVSVPFFKRAQLTAVDLHIAISGRGPGRFDDLERLTLIADNLVPHVLRHDGILAYDEALAARIDAGEPIPAGSAEEVEIRACTVHAGELLLDGLRRRGRNAGALWLDNLLWHRGQRPEFRRLPRHRTRTPFY
jgi:hypothetical protein